MAEKTAPPNGADRPPVRYEHPKAISRSPFNTENRTPDEDLIDSIRMHGVLQPLLVRPNPDGKPYTYELIAGERRWRGALGARLETVPIIIKQVSDREVLELQTVENDQRKDLSPIQRAQKYQQLLDQYAKDGTTGEKAIDRLCDKVGKKKSAVYEVLRLLKLPEPARQAVVSGKLPQSHAGLIAKLDGAPEVQARIVKQVLEPEHFDETEAGKEDAVLAFRNTKEIVDKEMKLVPARQKWDAAAAAHRAKGGEVMSEEQMLEVVSEYGGSVGGRFLLGSQKTMDYKGCGQYPGKSWRELMGKHAPPMILAHDRDYKILELYLKGPARKAVEKNGFKKKPPFSFTSGMPKASPEEQKQKEAERKARTARMKIVGAKAKQLLLVAATKTKPKFPWSQFLAWLDDVAFTDLSKAEIKKADTQPLQRILALLVEIMVAGKDHVGWQDYHQEWDQDFALLCKHYKIDLAKLEKELAPAPAKVQASGKAKTKKKGRK